MFGLCHIKFDSMTYVVHFKKGRIAKKDRGLVWPFFIFRRIVQ
jgi:hypothetical protein